MQNFRDLSPEERQKKIKEFMDKMTPEQRAQMEEMRKRYSPGAGQ